MGRRWSAWVIPLYPIGGVGAAWITYDRMVGSVVDCVHDLDGGSAFWLLFLGASGLVAMVTIALVAGMIAVGSNRLLRTSPAWERFSEAVPILVTVAGVALIMLTGILLLNEATLPADYCARFDQIRY
ncbi:hypothetical protein ACWDOP_06295 [Nocardia sp. NPDC003693]